MPLTAATLSNIPNKDATKATSINTLLNRIGGNLGYALVVTLLQQRLELHRIRLGEHISHAHTQAMSTFFGLKGFLAAHGFGPGADTVGAAKMLAGMVKRQALMLAYNDVSWLFLMMFLFVIVLVLFLPGKPKHPVSAEHAVVGE